MNKEIILETMVNHWKGSFNAMVTPMLNLLTQPTDNTELALIQQLGGVVGFCVGCVAGLKIFPQENDLPLPGQQWNPILQPIWRAIRVFLLGEVTDIAGKILATTAYLALNS